MDIGNVRVFECMVGVVREQCVCACVCVMEIGR